MIIRKGTLDDVNKIASFGRETFLDTFLNHPVNKHEDVMSYVDEAFTVEAITNEVNDKDCTFFLAELEDNTLVGYAKVKQNVRDNGVVGEKPMELCRIYVSKEHKGRGIGKELMLKCLSVAEENKNDVVWLGVWEYNTAAQEFYSKFGFKKCGEHIFQLGSDPQTDWIYQRSMAIKQ
jgi:ribosomal protein S18 acetylase RimI-like enzyme